MLSVSMGPATMMRNTAVRFGNQDKAQPETLKLFGGLADGGTLIYLASDDANKKYTFYIKPYAGATKERTEELLANQRKMAEKTQKNMPGITVEVKHFDDRPANALVKP